MCKRVSRKNCDYSDEGKETKIDNRELETVDLAVRVLASLGGKENVKSLDSCITRLRVGVNDIKKVDKEDIKALGAAGVLELGNNIHAIFGPKSDQLKTRIKDVIGGNRITPIEETRGANNKVVGTEVFVSPLSGKLLELKNVPDQVFSNKMLGDGFAIEPNNGEVVSPVNGKIETVFPSKHAIGIVADNNREILIHFGVDTVKLEGEGFEILVKQGEMIKVGQPILKVDLNKVKNKAPSLITAIIFTNLLDGEQVAFEAGIEVKAGQENIIRIK